MRAMSVSRVSIGSRRLRRRRPSAVGAAVSDDRGSRRRALRAVLGLLALSGALVGAWALLAPRSFYDDFPGAGRHWVSVDGPYNEHLVRDVGGLNLGLAAVAFLALLSLGPALVRAAGLGWLLFSLPHLIYHLNHLGPLPTADKGANVVGLSAVVVLALAALVLAGPEPLRPARARSA
jgi:hypothetical protein